MKARAIKDVQPVVRLMVRQDMEYLRHDVNYWLLDVGAQADELVRVYGDMSVEDMQARLLHCEQAVASLNKGKEQKRARFAER